MRTSREVGNKERNLGGGGKRINLVEGIKNVDEEVKDTLEQKKERT